jgi:hypothetical protein
MAEVSAAAIAGSRGALSRPRLRRLAALSRRSPQPVWQPWLRRSVLGGSTRMNTIGQPISRADGRLKVTGRARYTADIPVAGAVHAAIVHSTIANGRTMSIETSAAETAPGVLTAFVHSSQHAADESDTKALEPSPSPRSRLFAASRRQDPLCRSADPAGGRRDARPGGPCRDADQGRIRGPAAGGVRPRYGEGSRRSSAIPVTGRLVGRRCRQGYRGRCGQDRADVHDVRSPPQPDGAARHDGGLGRRRHADAL